MCYLNQVKHCKARAMHYLNYSKHNSNSTLCFSTYSYVKQNANNAMYLLNHVTHKTFNAFCFNQSKHGATKCNVLFESS